MATQLASVVFMVVVAATVLCRAKDDPIPPFGVCVTSSSDFQPTREFHQSLSSLFDSLVLNASRTGFAAGTGGRKPDQSVYGLLMCYGDASAGECKQCVSNAYGESPCESNLMWYRHCMMQYATTNFIGVVDTQNVTTGWTPDIVSDPVPFDEKVSWLVSNLTARVLAANESRWLKFATGDVALPGNQTLHGLVQCTRDISLNDCGACLRSVIAHTHPAGECCSGKPNVFMGTGSCIIRYSVPGLPPSTSACPPAGGRRIAFMYVLLVAFTTSIVTSTLHV